MNVISVISVSLMVSCATFKLDLLSSVFTDWFLPLSFQKYISATVVQICPSSQRLKTCLVPFCTIKTDMTIDTHFQVQRSWKNIIHMYISTSMQTSLLPGKGTCLRPISSSNNIIIINNNVVAFCRFDTRLQQNNRYIWYLHTYCHCMMLCSNGPVMFIYKRFKKYKNT